MCDNVIGSYDDVCKLVFTAEMHSIYVYIHFCSFMRAYKNVHVFLRG